jgi:hypothetical protein
MVEGKNVAILSKKKMHVNGLLIDSCTLRLGKICRRE